MAGAVVAEALAGAELAVEEEEDARAVAAEPGETSSEAEAAAQVRSKFLTLFESIVQKTLSAQHS